MSSSTDRDWRCIFCGAVVCHGAQPIAGPRHFTLVAALLCLCAQAGIAGAQETPKGLSKEQVLKLLKEDPLARVQYLVNKYGIAFSLTPDAEKELTQAGATPELLELVRKLAPAQPAEPKAQTSPPVPAINSSLPLSVSDVERGLKAGVTNARMAALVKQYGVDFELTDDVEQRLRSADANGDLLLEISRSRRTPSTPPISNPATVPSEPLGDQPARGAGVAMINIAQAVYATKDGSRELAALGDTATEDQRKQITQKVLTKMAPMIVKFSSDNGFGVVLDTTDPWPKGPILWADPKVDITRSIVSLYDGGPSNFVPTSDDKKVVAMNVEQAIFASQEGQSEFGALTKSLQPKQDELKQMNAELESLKKQFSSHENQLSRDALANLSKQIYEKQKRLELAVQSARDDAQKRQNAIAQKILNKMAPVIVKLAQTNGYGMVIDTSDPWPKSIVLWTTKGTDITKQVVEAYNAGNMSSTGSLGSAAEAGNQR